MRRRLPFLLSCVTLKCLCATTFHVFGLISLTPIFIFPSLNVNTQFSAYVTWTAQCLSLLTPIVMISYSALGYIGCALLGFLFVASSCVVIVSCGSFHCFLAVTPALAAGCKMIETCLQSFVVDGEPPADFRWLIGGLEFAIPLSTLLATPVLAWLLATFDFQTTITTFSATFLCFFLCLLITVPPSFYASNTETPRVDAVVNRSLMFFFAFCAGFALAARTILRVASALFVSRYSALLPYSLECQGLGELAAVVSYLGFSKTLKNSQLMVFGACLNGFTYFIFAFSVYFPIWLLFLLLVLIGFSVELVMVSSVVYVCERTDRNRCMKLSQLLASITAGNMVSDWLCITVLDGLDMLATCLLAAALVGCLVLFPFLQHRFNPIRFTWIRLDVSEPVTGTTSKLTGETVGEQSESEHESAEEFMSSSSDGSDIEYLDHCSAQVDSLLSDLQTDVRLDRSVRYDMDFTDEDLEHLANPSITPTVTASVPPTPKPLREHIAEAV